MSTFFEETPENSSKTASLLCDIKCLNSKEGVLPDPITVQEIKVYSKVDPEREVIIPVRKPGKLPREVIAQSYQLEYGQDTLELHTDAISQGDNVLIIDDLLATGGTVEATVKLVQRLGGEVKHAAFVINLPELGGEKRLRDLGIDCYTLVNFEGH